MLGCTGLTGGATFAAANPYPPLKFDTYFSVLLDLCSKEP